ncbi:uncharacterized protein LOC124272714 isoform X2 [Haliotis rubra]|uniref:uncharacterized protein LOC124272714 isoform X2 n=1 Tax=Haliotis rubra TaxID=36100 RepID=UPI001EE56A3B|nr:uncharacterized protein LOC124272714 isoform X2 [Haliotis rubra]
MACHTDPVSTTTYQKDYRVDRFVPAVRMTTLPMYQPGREKSTNQWRPSVKKVPGPPSSVLFARYVPKDKKTVTQSRSASRLPRLAKSESAKPRVLVTKFGLMDVNEVEQLAHKLKWTPTTLVATEEAHLPMSQKDTRAKTLEKRADMVRFDVQRYDDQPRMWQQAELFDRYQLRQPVERVVYPYDTSDDKKLPKRRGKEAANPRDSEKIRNLVQQDQIASVFVRHCPGYAGYVPRVPPADHVTKQAPNPSMVSTMKATYREIPREELMKRRFANSSQFAKAVTLTFPFNPYSKVGSSSYISE